MERNLSSDVWQIIFSYLPIKTIDGFVMGTEKHHRAARKYLIKTIGSSVTLHLYGCYNLLKLYGKINKNYLNVSYISGNEKLVDAVCMLGPPDEHVSHIMIEICSTGNLKMFDAVSTRFVPIGQNTTHLDIILVHKHYDLLRSYIKRYHSFCNAYTPMFESCIYGDLASFKIALEGREDFVAERLDMMMFLAKKNGRIDIYEYLVDLQPTANLFNSENVK